MAKDKVEDGKEHTADGPQMDHPDVVAANTAMGIETSTKAAKPSKDD
jgi:hypothetical protein